MNEGGGKSLQTLHLLYIGKNEFKIILSISLCVGNEK